MWVHTTFRMFHGTTVLLCKMVCVRKQVRCPGAECCLSVNMIMSTNHHRPFSRDVPHGCTHTHSVKTCIYHHAKGLVGNKAKGKHGHNIFARMAYPVWENVCAPKLTEAESNSRYWAYRKN